MVTIIPEEGEPIEFALRRFLKALAKSKFGKTLRRHEYAMTRSQRRRAERGIAIRRNAKQCMS